MEVWKKIQGLENYEVSSYGNVKGLEIKTRFGNGYKIYPERKIKPWMDKKGYFYIDISNKSIYTRFLLHRLVALHFILNNENKPQINHINGIKSDNKVENLEWCTAKENLKHARDTGLTKISGVDHYNSKLTKEDVFFIKNSSLRNIELCKKFNVAQGTISRIRLKKTYKND